MESTQIQLLVDKRNIRWIQILAKLERVTSISTKSLSRSLNISSRTIGSDIKEIKVYFSQSITIDPSTTGYTFKITDKITYIEKKKNY
ncbi:HTH domain-containing protein [Carnobacterium maltaromaticum]|uniref:HTH domain-containing protein n=1 Tax=Carnobacterium maltaromaticum TaxID=2751 RepID=UPI0039BDFF88